VRSVAVDSGFLIGLFDETDPLHPRCRAFLKALLATRTGVREILTADRRDFAVYRLGARARFIDVLAS
jgi:predicted nucleic acid-binding protein